MIRSTLLAAVLGAVVAGGTLYAVNQSLWSNFVAGWRGASDRAPEAKFAIEHWPTCATMGSIGSESDWVQLDPDFAAGKKALAAEDWNDAIASLKLAGLREPRNADIQNYIGYAYRRLRDLGHAMEHYRQALTLNPRHRGAHAHLGELFLVFREPAKAEEHLAALQRICLVPCEELRDLERAIAAYKSLLKVGQFWQMSPVPGVRSHVAWVSDESVEHIPCGCPHELM
jgi:tetratricopeptide (TPR) repeat protein